MEVINNSSDIKRFRVESPLETETRKKMKKMKSFHIPDLYKSSIIGNIKETRRIQDKLKKDFSPTVLDKCREILDFTTLWVLLWR